MATRFSIDLILEGDFPAAFAPAILAAFFVASLAVFAASLFAASLAASLAATPSPIAINGNGITYAPSLATLSSVFPATAVVGSFVTQPSVSALYLLSL